MQYEFDVAKRITDISTVYFNRIIGRYQQKEMHWWDYPLMDEQHRINQSIDRYMGNILKVISK